MFIKFTVMGTFMFLVSEVFSFFLKYVFILEVFIYKDKHKCIKLLLILCFEENHIFSLC